MKVSNKKNYCKGSIFAIHWNCSDFLETHFSPEAA